MATAFAVYCADDTSLSFYKRETVPTAGSVFEGKVATAVYTGIETEAYSISNKAPWLSFGSTITSVSFVDRVSPISTVSWFSNFTAIKTIDAKDLDVSNVTNMMGMFGGCYYLETLDISGWDTSKVTTMNGMFGQNMSLRTVYVSKLWSVKSVTASVNMFAECYTLVGGNGTAFGVGTDATYACIDTPETPGYFTYKKYYPLEVRGDHIIQGETLYDIAEAIRSKTGSTDSLTPSQMAAAIRGIGAS